MYLDYNYPARGYLYNLHLPLLVYLYRYLICLLTSGSIFTLYDTWGIMNGCKREWKCNFPFISRKVKYNVCSGQTTHPVNVIGCLFRTTHTNVELHIICLPACLQEWNNFQFIYFFCRLWSSGCRSRYQGSIGRLKFLRRPFCIIGKSNKHTVQVLA